MKLPDAAHSMEEGIRETLSYMNFPRTNNPMERMMKEIRLRTNIVGSFPDGKSALMLASARLHYMTYKDWGTRRYLNMELLVGWEVSKNSA